MCETRDCNSVSAVQKVQQCIVIGSSALFNILCNYGRGAGGRRQKSDFFEERGDEKNGKNGACSREAPTFQQLAGTSGRVAIADAAHTERKRNTNLEGREF